MRRHMRFSSLTVLSLTVVFGLCAEAAQAHSRTRGRSKRAADLPQLLERLAKDKDAFEVQKASAAKKVSSSFNALIRDVQRSNEIDLADRAALLKDLRAAKDAFEENQTLTPSPFIQDIYVHYIVAVRTGYYSLLERYDQAIRLVPAGDNQRETLEKGTV
jgi:hypothetical protein